MRTSRHLRQAPHVFASSNVQSESAYEAFVFATSCRFSDLQTSIAAATFSSPATSRGSIRTFGSSVIVVDGILRSFDGGTPAAAPRRAKALRDKGISRTPTRRLPAYLGTGASRFAFYILLWGYYFISRDPSRRPRNDHAVAPAISRSAVLPDGHGELVEEAICAGAERARPPGHLARHDHRDLEQRPERTRVRALPYDLGGPDRRFRKHRGRARIEADVRHAEPRPARLGGAPALLHGDGPGVDRPLDGSHLRARIAAANSGATLTFVCGDRTVSVAITSSQTFRFASAGPTKRPWTHAAITRRAPWAFSSLAAVAIVPPVEITSSTMPTDLPRTSSAFGSIFTVYESMRSFSRESNGTPAIADASFANRIALSSGARSISTFVDFRYRPIAGMPLTSRAGSGKVLRIPAL